MVTADVAATAGVVSAGPTGTAPTSHIAALAVQRPTAMRCALRRVCIAELPPSSFLPTCRGGPRSAGEGTGQLEPPGRPGVATVRGPVAPVLWSRRECPGHRGAGLRGCAPQPGAVPHGQRDGCRGPRPGDVRPRPSRGAPVHPGYESQSVALPDPPQHLREPL